MHSSTARQDVGKVLPFRKANIVTLADVIPEPVDWLWEGRIPYGKLTIIDGDPGTGKSHLTLEIAARVSRGQPLPGGHASEPGAVILLAEEDGLGDTIQPRLVAAGGDVTRVYALRDISQRNGDDVLPSFPDDIDLLGIAIRSHAATLVIIDPLMSYLSDGINPWSDKDVRKALMPLARLAQETGCAIVLIRHLNGMCIKGLCAMHNGTYRRCWQRLPSTWRNSLSDGILSFSSDNFAYRTQFQATRLTLLPAVVRGPPLQVDLRRDLEATATYLSREKAPATRRAYRSDVKLFSAWCTKRGLVALPARPETVAVFLASQAKDGIKAATVSRRVAAIRDAHRARGLESPTHAEQVKAIVRGVRRTIGTAQAKKTPATAELVLAMVQVAPNTLRGLRDRALLLLGFAGAFRRSELAALVVSDLEEVSEGLRVTLRRSKTDQEGVGRIVPIPRGSVACPVAAIRAWLDVAAISQGPIFRSLGKGGRVLPRALSTRSIGIIVQLYAERVGLNPQHFGGHSLRAGFLTSAAARGANLFRLMDQSGHKSVETVRGYVRRAEEFKDHAGTGLL